VTWWFRGKEIGRSGAGSGDLDRNFNVRGHGPTTELTITPLRSDYYGFYKCKAENPYGIAYHEIELEEAREPSKIQQVIIDKTTATTILFRFVAPTDTGGLPLDAYAVEYKDSRKDWISAKRRVWPARDISDGGYVLEGLVPKATYDLRFGSKNRVGFSEWSGQQTLVMPAPGPPQPPTLKTDQFGVELEPGVVEVNTSNSYELSWKIPEDNGVPIDYFLLTYYRVNRADWSRVGDIVKKEIPHRGNVRDRLDLQFQDTYYKIVLQAHNQMGFSQESSIIIKTRKDAERGGTLISPPSMLNSKQQTRINMSLIAIIFILTFYFSR